MIQSLHRYSLQLITIYLTTCLTNTPYSFIRVFPSPAIWLGSVINHPIIINVKATLQLLRYGKGTQAASSSHWFLPSFHWSCCLATASKVFFFTSSYESFNRPVETKETSLLFKLQDVATHRHAHPNVNQLPRTSKQVEDFLSSKGPLGASSREERRQPPFNIENTQCHRFIKYQVKKGSELK